MSGVPRTSTDDIIKDRPPFSHTMSPYKEEFVAKVKAARAKYIASGGQDSWKSKL